MIGELNPASQAAGDTAGLDDRRSGVSAATVHCEGRSLVVTSGATITGFGALFPSRYPALNGMRHRPRAARRDK